MLLISNAQIDAAQRPADAAAITTLADAIATRVAQASPDIPMVLTRLNVRMFLVSLARHGVPGLADQEPLVTRYFTAGAAMARAPHSDRWRHALIARDMTPEAKLRQLDQVLKDAEAALLARK
jgi:hypothetical protein